MVRPGVGDNKKQHKNRGEIKKLIPVADYFNPALLGLAEEALRRSNIPFVVKNESITQLYPSAHAVPILVPEDREEEARELLLSLEQDSTG